MAADSEGDEIEADGEGAAEESQWRFSLEDIDAMQGDDEGGNVAGSLDHEQPLEPGEISRENALFVVLGVLLVVVFIAAVIVGF